MMMDGLIKTMASVMGVKAEDLQEMALQTFNNVKDARDAIVATREDSAKILARLEALEERLNAKAD